MLEIDPVDTTLKADLTALVNNKTKPVGALGVLESLAIQFGLVQKTLSPKIMRPIVLIFAGDHGIVEEGVSPYPQAVTAQMVNNFLTGGAAINVFAKQHDVLLKVIDSGVNHQFKPMPLLANAKVAFGTKNFRHEPAMTVIECERAITLGEAFATKEAEQGSNVFAFGEMGIGNTSSASCLMSVLCDLPIAKCVGRGAGLNDKGLIKKTKVLRKALEQHQVTAADPMLVLATFGGFEIAMMVGAMLSAAKHGAVLLIDGFIATSALLVAAKMQPNIMQYCIFSHASNEVGHQAMLAYLKARPLLNLDLRLGEGTGAVLAYPLVQSAVNFLNEMASFSSAGISGAE